MKLTAPMPVWPLREENQVALFRERHHAASHPRGGIAQRRPPAAWLQILRTALAAIVGMACACGTAFAVGAFLGPVIGWIPAFLPAAAAAAAILFFFFRLARL